MKIVTWNVNSIRSRLPRLLPWLERTRPDVVCLQETKVVDENFPLAEIESLGYHCILNGQKTYNGVAILSLAEPEDPVRNLPGDDPDCERRLIGATFNGIRVIGVYAPNGGDVGTDRYAFKLDWYRRLRKYLDETVPQGSNLLICGDFNVAPDDRDVWDPEYYRGRILFSEPEKEVLRNLMDWGLVDALRLHRQEGGIFTWWDYRAGAFHRGWGMRIDHILVSQPLEGRVKSVEVDRNERKGTKPSDHAPVIATVE